eukprot:scaffold3431_cov307-Prasinococcus_capsulatus_cf.AAC.2
MNGIYHYFSPEILIQRPNISLAGAPPDKSRPAGPGPEPWRGGPRRVGMEERRRVRHHLAPGERTADE